MDATRAPWWKSWRYSLIETGLLAALIIALISPGLGQVLGFLGVTVFVPLLANALLVVFAWESFRARSRLWVIPVAIYLAYGAAIVAGYQLHARDDQRLRAENEAVQVDFDPLRQDLVVNDDALALQLLTDRELERVYVRQADGRTVLHRALPRSACNRVTVNVPGVLEKSLFVPLSITSQGVHSSNDLSACIVSWMQKPTRPFVRIDQRWISRKGWLRDVLSERFDLIDGSGRRRSVAWSRSAVLANAPLPLIACWSDSRWACRVEFVRKHLWSGAPEAYLGSGPPVHLAVPLNEALHLRPRAIDQLAGPVLEHALTPAEMAQIQSLNEAEVEAGFARLAAQLSRPRAVNIPDLDDLLRLNPEHTVRAAPELLQGLEHAYDRRDADSVRVLASSFNGLSPDQFVLVRPGIEALLARRPEIAKSPNADALNEKLRDPSTVWKDRDTY
jgi:hypothetical protein